MYIDHLVLVTSDIKKTINFYTKILEMQMKKEYFESDGSTRYSVHFNNQKINLHELGKSFLPHAHKTMPGSLDICFISFKSIKYWLEKLKKSNIKIIEGPVKRSGSVGQLLSIYCRDPNLNLIEVANIINNND